MGDEHRKARLNHLLATDFDGVQVALANFASRGDKVYSRSRINQMAGTTEPFGEKAAQAFAEACGLPSAWFENDWLTPWEARQSGRTTRSSNAHQLESGAVAARNVINIGAAEVANVRALPGGRLESHAERVPYLPGFEALSIPLLAQGGSMGLGEDQLSDEVVVGRLTVSPHWVTKTIKPLTKLENLRFIHGYGDSMDPTFNDGDILLVDVGVKDHRVDGVYVLEANDRIYIKRVRQRLNGSFEVSSDNPTVKTVDELNSPATKICGRVVWAWNGKKL